MVKVGTCPSIGRRFRAPRVTQQSCAGKPANLRNGHKGGGEGAYQSTGFRHPCREAGVSFGSGSDMMSCPAIVARGIRFPASMNLWSRRPFIAGSKARWNVHPNAGVFGAVLQAILSRFVSRQDAIAFSGEVLEHLVVGIKGHGLTGHPAALIEADATDELLDLGNGGGGHRKRSKAQSQ